jgi:Flp pilus assembly protein TadD
MAPALALGADVLPAHPWLGLTYLELGRVDEAVRLLEGASEKAVNRPSVMAALAYGAAGRDADARAVIQTLEERAREEYFPRSWLARAYAASGDKERALTWLERAYEERDGWLTLAKVDPTFDALREEPRFRAVLAKMGLP